MYARMKLRFMLRRALPGRGPPTNLARSSPSYIISSPFKKKKKKQPHARFMATDLATDSYASIARSREFTFFSLFFIFVFCYIFLLYKRESMRERLIYSAVTSVVAFAFARDVKSIAGSVRTPGCSNDGARRSRNTVIHPRLSRLRPKRRSIDLSYAKEECPAPPFFEDDRSRSCTDASESKRASITYGRREASP